MFLREFSRKDRSSILKLLKFQYITKFFCTILYIIILAIPLMLTSIIYNFYKDDFKSMDSMFLAFMILYFIIAACLLKISFENPNSRFCRFAYKSYYRFFTSKGSAISKEDFKTIKTKNSKLYDYITTQSCRGICYQVCFYILKSLRKGKLKFVAITNFVPEAETKEFNLTMHVFYANNGWVFDTYSHRQYPVDRIDELFNGLEYRDFSFSELMGLSYDDFINLAGPALAKWCQKNEVTQIWYTGPF